MISLQQAAANALAAWLKSRVGDAVVFARWPEPNVKLPPKAISVLLAGPRQDEELDPIPIARRDLSRTHAEYTWRMRLCKQPMQLDVWARSDAARDDLVAHLDRALNASEKESMGAVRADPVRNGVLLRIGDEWDGFADFLFDAPETFDTPDAAQRCEYRATYRGHAWMDLTMRAESPRLVAATLRQRLYESDPRENEMAGPVYVTSVSAARRHGVYAIERTPPPSIRAIGTGVCALVLQSPWGPDQALTTPSGLKDLYDTIAPAGMDRTWSGYLSIIRKAWPTLKFVRVLGPSATPATCTLGANIALVTARCKGTAGNSLLATVSNASDGDPNHFDLAVSIAGASGITTDSLKSINFSGAGADSVVDTKRALLVGSVRRTAAGRPPNGTYAFTNATDGAVNAGAYTGTQGANDRGLALFESDGSIRKVFSDDPGAAMRPAVNGALRAHAESLGDRVAFLNGSPGQSLADVKADVANYRSVRAVYTDPWVYILDDVDGTKRLVPSAPFAASVAAQLSPSTSIAWKDPKVIAMLAGIVDLEVERGQGTADNTDNGVATIIREENGGFSIEAGVLTVAPTDPGRRNLTRTQTGDYIAVSFQRSVRPSVDAPSVPLNHDGLVLALEVFMDGMKRNAKTDPNNLPHVVDYDIPALSSVNSDADLESGLLFIPLDAKMSPAQEKIFLSVRFGENVSVKHEA